MIDDVSIHKTTAVEIEPASMPDPAPPPGWPPEEATRAKVCELALRQLDRFISYQSKVLKGDNPDAIHDMRVASRRLQQVLDLLYRQPRPGEVRRIRRQIRRCREALGDVRNCDVLLQIVGRFLARKRSARREAWTAVQHFLSMQRSEAFRRATRKLGKLNLTMLYVTLKPLLRPEHGHGNGGAAHAPHDGSSAPAFAQDLNDALESTWSRFESQMEHSRHSSRPEVIHGARIAAKRLRYLLEVLHEIKVPGSAGAISGLRQLQNLLGDWHDREVLEQMMIALVARPEFLRDQLSLAMQVERLILRNRTHKAKLEEEYAQALQDSGDLRRLKEWIAALLAAPGAASAAL